MIKRYIKLGKISDIELLKSYVISSKYSHNVRRRSQGILLSIRNYSVQQISEILEVAIPTVYDWFNRYESEGVEGMLDKPRSGRPLILSESEQKKL